MNITVHKLLGILLPPLILAALLFLQFPFCAFNFFSYVRRSLSTENVAGKVVLITGAASGIGKQVAYEYARRGSFLVLGPMFPSSKIVGNSSSKLSTTLADDVNFRGSVYGTHFAIPHLRKNRGKVIVISSVCGLYPIPNLGIYNASKAALISFYETLRSEVGSEIGVTIVTPGFTATGMTQRQDEQNGLRDLLDFIPMQTAKGCAEAIVRGACKGDRYLIEPSWMKVLYMLRVLCLPELIDWCNLWLFVTRLQNRCVARMKKLQEDAKPHKVTNDAFSELKSD